MTTTPKETRMPTDPNWRALLRAVEKLTTQVRRIADTLTDGTVQDSFALAPPVVTDDDGAQTTADDTPAWKLCTCGDRPVAARHPESCPLSRDPYASELAEMHGTEVADDTRPLILRTISHWEPVCESGRHPAHALQTCAEIDAFTTFLQNRMQQQSAADWKATAAVYSGLHRTAENELKQAHAELAEATAAIERVRRALADRPALCTDSVYERGWSDAADMVRNALDGPVAEG